MLRVRLVATVVGSALGTLGALLWNVWNPHVNVCAAILVCRRTATGCEPVQSCPSPGYPWMVLVAGLLLGAIAFGTAAWLVTSRNTR